MKKKALESEELDKERRDSKCQPGSIIHMTLFTNKGCPATATEINGKC